MGAGVEDKGGWDWVPDQGPHDRETKGAAVEGRRDGRKSGGLEIACKLREEKGLGGKLGKLRREAK